jgi:hypothetical protein
MRRARIAARCPSKRRVLLDGVGFQGVGMMWVDEDDGHKDREGYATAKIVETCPDGPFGDDLFMQNLRK